MCPQLSNITISYNYNIVHISYSAKTVRNNNHNVRLHYIIKYYLHNLLGR